MIKKFNDLYKEKQVRSNELLEGKLLNEFKSVYGTLLEKYSISDFYTLNEEEQVTFLAELNSYWNDIEGLSDKGKKFIQIRSDVLSESSTSLQKKNYLKNKTSKIISETIRQSELKWKLYDIINEMYNEIQAKGITDILSPDNISDIIQESFKVSLDSFVKEIRTELNESAKEVDANILNEKKKEKAKDPDAEVRNRGDVVFSAESKLVKDKKDHFPCNNIAQGRNSLARVEQYSSVPSWYNGTLTELKTKVKSFVHKKYPSIKSEK